MASTKKLSNGTLSLRFMQKAKNLQALRQDPGPAKVQHEAEWTVPGYRVAAGVKSQDSISYEPSYMPFLYEAQDSHSTPPRTSGRRVFKHGKELEKPEINADAQESPPKSANSEDDSEDEPSTSSRPGQRKSSNVDLKPELRSAPPPRPTPSKPMASASGFLRPGGVDAPPSGTGRKLGSVAAALLEKKPKREAEDLTSIPSQANKKRKTDKA